eukprot:TRINITY_DN1212_c0_g1_i2.p1 TRINITY_DN1212_c0_g1~~TRINITY_DN1212_c0_g1_i2.p1  ORF type:complete len:703 (+),score=204.05 TRINITY_DN1212_c0_g1_i2:100-2208(+)
MSKCAVCGKIAYNMEKVSVEGVSFHKSCFKCTECKSTLKLGNYASLKGKYYCKPHFKQLFALKGNYDEGFGGEQHKKKWIGKEGDASDINSPGLERQPNEDSSSADKTTAPTTHNSNTSHATAATPRETVTDDQRELSVYAKGVGLQSAKVKQGERTLFTVFAKDPEHSVAKLAINVAGPSAPEVEVFDNEDQSYDVEWEPKTEGTFILSVKMNGKHISESPFTVVVGNPSTASQPVTQSPAHVDTKRDSEPKLNIKQDSSSKLEPLPKTDSTPKLETNPTAQTHKPSTIVSELSSEEYYTSAAAKGQGLDGLRVKAGELSVFTVVAKDKSLSANKIEITISGPGQPKAEIYSNDDGTFDVEWLPPSVGRYFISVKIDNKPIPGSPFDVLMPGAGGVERAAVPVENHPSASVTRVSKLDTADFQKKAQEEAESKVKKMVDTEALNIGKKIDFEQKAKEDAQAHLKRQVSLPKVNQGGALDRVSNFQMAAQESDKNIKRMVDPDEIKAETKKLSASEFEKLAQEQSQSKIKRMVDSPTTSEAKAKSLTAAFESKKMSSVEVKRMVDKPVLERDVNAKNMASLWEKKPPSPIEVKRMVDQPSVSKGAGLTRAQMFEKAAQESRNRVTKMVDVESVQSEAKGKKIQPSEFERRAKEQAERKVKRMVSVDEVTAEAKGKKLTPEEFEKRAKEESEAKVKRNLSVHD